MFGFLVKGRLPCLAAITAVAIVPTACAQDSSWDSLMRAMRRSLMGGAASSSNQSAAKPKPETDPQPESPKAKREEPSPAAKPPVDHATLETLERELMVKESCGRAAGQLGRMGPAGMAVLAKGLREKTSDVHWAAAWQLGRMGEAALPILADALTDPNASIQYAAASGLTCIGVPARETLIGALKHDNTSVRRRALEGLGEMCAADKVVLPLLIEATRDPDKGIRGAAAHSLGKAHTKEAMDALFVMLKNNPENDNVAYALREYGDAAIPGLAEALQSDNAKTRALAAKALGHLGQKADSSIPAIVESLKDVNIDYSTFEALGKLGPKMLPLFAKALESDDSRQRRAAAHGLNELGPQGVPLLLKALGDSDQYVRSDAAMAISRVAKPVPKEAIPLLIQSMHDRSSRYSAAHALSYAGSEGTAGLIAATKSGDENLREVAINALRRMDAIAEEAVPAFIEALGAENAKTQSAAREALARLGVKAVPALMRIMKHEDPDVRIEAARLLEGSGSKDAIPTLVAALSDSDTTVRMHAAQGLARLGPAAGPGVPGLAILLHDDDVTVRLAAVRALGRIGEASVVSLIAVLENPEVRGYAEEALVSVGTPAIPTLLAARGNATGESRELFENLIVRIGPSGQVPLVEAMTSSDADTRRACVFLLGRIGPTAVPALAGAVQDADTEVRMLAIDGLTRIGTQAGLAVRELVIALQDRDDRVAMLAADALGAIGPAAAEAAPSLVTAMKGRTLRTRASEALARIGNAAVPALIPLLGEADTALRGAAVYALGRAGQESEAAAQALMPLLRDKDDVIRLLAADALGQVGVAAVTGLRKTLAVRNSPERWLVALALGRMGEKAKSAAGDLAKAVVDSDAEVASAAAAALGQIGPAAKEAVPVLCESLKTVNGETRLNVGWALWQIDKHPWSSQVLAQALESSETYLRVGAALALSRIGPAAKEAVPELTKALEDENEEVCGAAALALSQIGKPAHPAVGALRKALDRANGEARLNIGWALWQIQEDPWGPQVLAQTLAHSDPKVRLDSAAAITSIGPMARETVPALTAALKDKTPVVRAAAAMALGRIGADAKSAAAALADALEDACGETRLNIAWALWQVDKSDLSVPCLIEMLKDTDPKIRQGSAAALAQIGAPAKDAVPALGELLRDANAEMRAMAAAALGQLGPAARPAVPALLAAIKDEDETVRDMAGPALLASGEKFVWALPTLVKAFEHEPLRVRKAAAAALLWRPRVETEEKPLSTKQLVEILEQQEGEEDARCVAALMLAARSREASNFVGTLQDVLAHEPNSNVRWSVLWALGIALAEQRHQQ